MLTKIFLAYFSVNVGKSNNVLRELLYVDLEFSLNPMPMLHNLLLSNVNNRELGNEVEMLS